MKQINQNEFEWDISNKYKKESKIKDYLQNKYIVGSLVLTLLAGGGYIIKQTSKDKRSENKEIIIENNYPFEKEKIPYRDNTKFKNGIVEENPAKGIYLKHDAWLTFYVVQTEDIKEGMLDLEGIRIKLAKLEQFKYLKRDEYERKTPNNKIRSFNVPKGVIDKQKINHINNGRFYIPIPIDSDFRELSAENFTNYCYEAIQEMKKNTIYGSEINKILETISEKELLAIMLAFARSESTEEYTSFTQNIGTSELHRREDHIGAFSFTYFHILMEKNADGKTSGPGLKARLDLGLTEGECYHPKNAAKLFLGYYINKLKILNNMRAQKKNPLPPYKRLDLFPINDNNIKTVSKIYNGSSAYSKKLGPNYEFAQNLINTYDNKDLIKIGFEYLGLNSKQKKVYKYTTQEKVIVKDLKKQIVKVFNKNKDKDCPKIKENNIVRSNGSAISDKIILNQGDSIYILVD